jgi:hypothetical protein
METPMTITTDSFSLTSMLIALVVMLALFAQQMLTYIY